MVKMVVFDMAGTTVNEDNIVYKTLKSALDESGFHFSLDQVLAEGAGMEKLQAIKSILHALAGNEDEKLANVVYARFLVLLASAYDNQRIYPQDNALQLFRALKKRDIKVVLNTGYNSETAHLLLNKLNWKSGVEYDLLVTSTDVRNNRPKPDMIRLAMSYFDISDAAAVAKVGDSIIDIEEGKNAGCLLAVGITTGAHTREQLQSANPSHIINNLLDLLPLLQSTVPAFDEV